MSDAALPCELRHQHVSFDAPPVWLLVAASRCSVTMSLRAVLQLSLPDAQGERDGRLSKMAVQCWSHEAKRSAAS